MATYRMGMRLLGTVSVLALGLTSAVSAQEINADPDLLLGLEDEGFLGTIELSAGKREVQTSTATPLTVINQEEIEDRQAGTIAELIDSVPGVSLVNGSRPEGSGINIRGFGANGTYGSDQKVAVVVDGVRTGSEEVYRIGTQLLTDPSLYKQVDVVRGTVGTFEYGSGIIGGLVKLETKDASDFTGGEVGLRFRQTLDYQTNGEGYGSSSIIAWQPMENVEVLLNYTKRGIGNYEDANGNTVLNTASQPYSGLAKVKYTFGDSGEHAITASYQQSVSSERDAPYDQFNQVDFGNVNRDTEATVYSLRYDYNPLNNDLINLQVQYSYSNQTILSESVDPTSTSGLLNGDLDETLETFLIKNSMFFQTGAFSHDLRAGIELSRRDRTESQPSSFGPGFSVPGGTDKRLALFVVDDISYNNWTFSPAIRWEDQSIESDGFYAGNTGDNSALMGGFSARYEFASGLALFASAAYTENLAVIDDASNLTFLSQPEKSSTYEVGASYIASDVFGSEDSLQFKVNLFNTRLWDVTSYSGVHTVDAEGVELEATYAMANGLYFDLNAAYGDYTQLATDRSGVTAEGEWTNAPANTARLTVGKRIGEAWDLSWEQVLAEDGHNNYGGYSYSNLRATYRVQNGALEGATVRLGIENAFDKSYQPNLATQAAAGRNIKLTLAKTF